MQAAVNAEMRVAENAETTVVEDMSRSEGNRMKTGSAGRLELNFTSQGKIFYRRWQEIQNWDIFVLAFLLGQFVWLAITDIKQV